MMKIFRSRIPTDLFFGPGSLDMLAKAPLPGSKALLAVSSGKSAVENGSLKRVKEMLEARGVEYVEFNRIDPNPTYESAVEAAEAAKTGGCDFIVALGGGSVVDCAKAAAIAAANEGDLWDYVWGSTGGRKPLDKEPIPVVAIPTTAGTGTEVDAWGVVSKLDTREKIGVGGTLGSFPALSIVDSELMATVPPELTAYQGFDALFHSIEGYLANSRNRLSDMYALEAIRSIAEGLPRAIENGEDAEARELVAFGSTLSGLVMAVGNVMSEHSIEHAMSARHPDLPHGAGLIMISISYFKHLIDRGAEPERFTMLARALGKFDATRPDDFLIALRTIQERCGVHDLKMSDWGITIEELPEIARNAKETMYGLFSEDPVEITIKDAANILSIAYK